MLRVVLSTPSLQLVTLIGSVIFIVLTPDWSLLRSDPARTARTVQS